MGPSVRPSVRLTAYPSLLTAGLRSYGKVVYAIVLLAMISFFTVCIQLLSWTEGLNEFFTDKFLFDNVFWSTVVRADAMRDTFSDACRDKCYVTVNSDTLISDTFRDTFPRP